MPKITNSRHFFSKKDGKIHPKIKKIFSKKDDPKKSRKIYPKIKKVKYDIRSSSKSKHLGDSLSALQDDLRKMLENKNSSDVNLQVSNVIIPAHKFILRARSPVFDAMFDHQDSLENQTGIVDIQDVDATTMNYFLEFLYTGFLKDMNFSDAMKLLLAADKYQIPSLIEMCVDFVKSKLSNENICVAYATASMINHKRLKMCVLEFIQTGIHEFVKFEKISKKIIGYVASEEKLEENFMYKVNQKLKH